jgi:hypothetical protein
VLSFTDLSTANFSIPKQYNAEVMIRAFIKYPISIMESFLNESKPGLEIIKFVTLDAATVPSFHKDSLKYSTMSWISSLMN